jgi:hypothetical protein
MVTYVDIYNNSTVLSYVGSASYGPILFLKKELRGSSHLLLHSSQDFPPHPNNMLRLCISGRHIILKTLWVTQLRYHTLISPHLNCTAHRTSINTRYYVNVRVLRLQTPNSWQLSSFMQCKCTETNFFFLVLTTHQWWNSSCQEATKHL